MKIILHVIGKNRETDEQEVFELGVFQDQIACLYKDRYGVAVTTRQGKFYRVTQTITELKELLW